MIKTPQDIILKPIITEKSMIGMENKKYTFKVATDANKIEIAKAAETLFGVDVKKVHTMNVRGRAKRVGQSKGYRSDWKKAIITLTENSKGISFFEGLN